MIRAFAARTARKVMNSFRSRLDMEDSLSQVHMLARNGMEK